jgi:hypothetical protein
MEKPILAWLEKLEEPYRSEALENHNPNYYEWMGSPEVDNVVDALGFAFWWRASPQGQDYWNELAESLEKTNQ